MAYIKVGEKYLNEKFLDKEAVSDYKKVQEFSGQDRFINKINNYFGKGVTPPKLLHETPEYTANRVSRENGLKKNQLPAEVQAQRLGSAARNVVQPTYGYSRQEVNQAKPTALENLTGVLKGGARFATDVLSLVPLGIQGIGSLIGSEKIKQFGATAGEELQRTKEFYKPNTVGEAKASGFTELGLNVFPAGTLGKGKYISLIAKETKSVPNMLKLLEKGGMLPKGLPKEDAARVAESLLKVSDEKSILNTIYAESIFKKAEQAIGKPLSTKAKMLVETSIKTTPIDDPKAFQEQMVEKIKSTVPPEELLISEAKKYKSAEDYVSAKTNGGFGYEVKELPITGKGATKTDEPFYAVWSDGPMKGKPMGASGKSLDEVNDAVKSLNERTGQNAVLPETKKELTDLYMQATKGEQIKPPTVAKVLGKKPAKKLSVSGEKALKKSLKAQQRAGKAGLERGTTIGKKEGTLKAKASEKIRVAKAEEKATATGAKALKRSLKAQEKAGQAGVKRGTRKGKSIGRKLGTFKAKAKEKIKVQQIHQSYQKKATTLANFRKSVRQYVSDLPKAVQRRVLSQVRFSEVKTGKQLNNIIDTVDKARAGVLESNKQKKAWKEVAAILKVLREKDTIGQLTPLIKKLGFVNKEGKQLKNIREAIKKAPREKLEKILSKSRKILDTTPKKLDRTGVDFEKVEKVGSSKTKTRAFLEDVKGGIRSALGVASTNIRRIGGDKLFYMLRDRTLEINRLSAKYAVKMEEFEKGMRKMQKDSDYTNIADALFNQDFDRARAIAEKHGFGKSLDEVISILDEIHANAKSVGFKLGKLVNYFPRIVKDYDGLFAAFSKKYGKEGRSYLDKVLTDEAKKKFKTVDELTTEERSAILTKAARGYGAGKINVGNVARARKVKEIPVEFLKYYHTPEDALTMYVSKMNERITLKKIFGLDDLEQDSLGSLIDGMKISPDEMHQLKESLAAVLSPSGKENAVLNKLRKSATLTLLAHISATLFQIADIGVNAYKHGGMRALASLFKAKPFRRDELFTDILHEFSDSQIIKKSLKAVGFDRLDRLNSEAFMAEAFRKAGREAKLGKGADYEKLREKLKPMFQGNEEKVTKVLDDLKNQTVNKDTQFYVFNEILDVSPRALMEMPEAYLKNPNARIFYSMKSYGIKVLDVYRKDVLQNWKKNPKESVKNFVRLTAFLTMSGASGSQVRDWYNGKDTKFSDNVINNLLQTMMLSTYDVSNVQRDGLGRTLLSKALPPSRVIDDISKDLVTLGNDKGFQSVRDIPIVGGEIYNRVGRGRDAIEKQNRSNQ